MKQGIIFRIFTKTVPIIPALVLLSWATSDVLAVPPPPSSGDYTNSGHGQGVTRAATAAKGYVVGNCIHCHEQHTGASSYLKFTSLTGYQFCTNAECHSATGSAANIKDAWELRSSTHGNAVPAMACVDCHEVHYSGPSHSPGVDGNDATKGAIKGKAGVEVVTGGWDSAPPLISGTENLSTPTYVAIDPIVKEYQLCLKCHSSYGGGPPTGLSDQGQEFNPYNASSHPIELQGSGPIWTWKNPFLQANAGTAMKAPWIVAGRRMHCSDCHGGDGITDPKGPHGSNNVYMLKAVGPSVNSPFDDYDNLCLICHDPYNVSAFADHNTGGHPDGCLNCHGGNNDTTGVGNWGGRPGNIHGNNYLWTDYDDRGTIRPGLPSRRFLIGGSLTKIWDEGSGVYGCSQQDQDGSNANPGCGQHGSKTWQPPDRWPNTLP